jgi:solute:Na+ symporter, SSS family
MPMATIDWIIIAAYMIGTLAVGVYLAKRASGSMVDFFVGGRTLPWWLAGTSMAATTFSIDTPLYVAGVVGTRGIAGNWEWWGYAIAHIILIYVFARLWRRAEIVTDNELTELRYGGNPAATLRAVKGFLFAVVIGSIGAGYAMLAMVKVVDALQIFPALGLDLGDAGKLWAIIGIGVFVLLYAGIAGLWGVVATDFFQFFLALAGAIVVAVVAVNHVGGLDDVHRIAQQTTDFDLLAFTPFTFSRETLIGWSEAAGITAATFFSYVAVLWWAFRRSDGGGEFIQRLSAVRNEGDAEKAAWFFNIMHYVVRTWPWVIVAIVALAIYPDLEDKELGYPMLMLDYLPAGILGLVVASLLAAFMSTMSTLINWSASYMTNDLYARFMRPKASQRELVFAARVASVIVMAIAGFAAFQATSIATVYRLILAVGTGPGLVLILRWYWWRVNAYAELVRHGRRFRGRVPDVHRESDLQPADRGFRTSHHGDGRHHAADLGSCHAADQTRERCEAGRVLYEGPSGRPRLEAAAGAHGSAAGAGPDEGHPARAGRPAHPVRRHVRCGWTAAVQVVYHGRNDYHACRRLVLAAAHRAVRHLATDQRGTHTPQPGETLDAISYPQRCARRARGGSHSRGRARRLRHCPGRSATPQPAGHSHTGHS